MPDIRPADRYGTTSIILHWLMVLLFIAVYASIELREIFPKGSPPREAMKSWHFMLGLSIFALVWLRLLARLVRPAPSDFAAPGWQTQIAGAVHAGLYLLMIGLPLLGWMLLSAEGKPVAFFGIALSPLIAPDEALAERLKALHETVGKIGYGLIGLHAFAALFHHYVLRDAVLSRMLPARS